MTSVRVATFNIRHGEGTDGVIDLERVAAAITATGAELVALQEVDRSMERTGGVDQPGTLERLTGLPIVFRRIVKLQGGDYGIALAGRDLKNTSFLRLPSLGDEAPRALLSATWRGVRVFSTHLATERKVREEQTRFLAERAKGARRPALVIGDLNQERPALGPLLDAGFSPGPGEVPTFGKARRRQIDFVLAGPGLEVVRTWTIMSDASDHVPLAAEIDIP